MEAIGQEFQRDHSTVVYSIKTMEENIKRDQHLKEMCSDIMKNVRTWVPFLKERNQRTLNSLSRGRDLGCTLRSIAHSHPSIWNFFGSFFVKKERPVFQQSFQLSTARIPRGLLKKGVFRVFHRKVHRLFKTIHPRFSAAQSGPAEFSTKLTTPTTTTTIV